MYNVSKVIQFCNVSLRKSNRIESVPIDYYDLTFVLRGRLEYIADSKHLIIREGDAMLLPPGTLRARIAHGDAVEYVSFNFELLDGRELALPRLMKNAVDGEIRALFNAFTPRHLSDEPRAREKATLILEYILEVLLELCERQTQNPHVRRAIIHIETHISEPIGLSALAEALHLSREYTANLIKRETGRTVSELVNDAKLTVARKMITLGSFSLSEIAESLGYENYGYFSRIFKKKYGYPPIKLNH